ncbi:hypothetical protein LZG04_10550 [Saccharothrix sp. S26]|uniref:hypothetical protein n=1 Tax=Saccharothrix sp. S26 TaxID=2907215 RepID=UPI001F364198|nr:hypothetical protein [Saccharothrix sp. S26]MCE6995247.1 hypothetical protein [Saccharothrix sp. S26]
MDENQVGAVRETAGQEGTAVAQHARQAAGEVGSTARDQVGQVAHEATGQAKHVVRDMRERVATEAEEQARRVSRQIDRIADELGTMADGSGPDSLTAGALRQVSDAGRQAARYLDERGARGLLDSAQDFARRKPGTFLIGAAVAGFLVARAAKSMSGSDQSQSRQPQPQRGYTDQTPTTPVTTPTAVPSATATPSSPSPMPSEYGTLAPQIPSDHPTPSPRAPYQPEGSPYVQR